MRVVESGFSSATRTTVTDATFPAGLRVLVVDDDLTWLKILEKMLEKCSYEVTTCCMARDALKMLRERKDDFDIIISDVNMPDMDGFKLLEFVGLEMDLPVIMMSVDGETNRVMKGVQHGACDYLLKPIQMKELKNIWLHVFRKKIHEAKCNETRWGRDDYDDEQQLNGGNSDAVKKRKDIENKRHDQELADPSASKKARVVWSVELHQKFVDAVNLIGFDNAGPKKILDLMNVPRLTRENVASHLQKYRLYLSRLPQESEIRNSFLGTKQQDFSISDPCGRFGLQNSVAAEQKNVAYESSEYTQNNTPADMGPEKHEGHWKCMPSIFPVITEFPDPQTASIKSQMGFANCSVFPHQNVQFQPLESSLRAQEWNEVPRMQFKQPPNQKLEPFPMLEADYSYMLLPDPHHIEGYIQHSDPRTIPERDESTPVKTPLSTQNSSSNSRSETPMRRIITSIPLPADSCVIKPEYFEAISSVTLSMKSPVVGSNCKSNWQPVGQNLNAVDHSAWPSSLEEKIEFCLPQEYGNAGNLALQNVELLDYSNLEFFTAKHNGDELEFSYDMLRNSIDNSFDQGLFIV